MKLNSTATVDRPASSIFAIASLIIGFVTFLACSCPSSVEGFTVNTHRNLDSRSYNNILIDTSRRISLATIDRAFPPSGAVSALKSTTMTADDVVDLDSKLLNEILEVAIDASQKAGSIIMQNNTGADVMKTKANSRDLLTEIDPLCEKTIRETVLAKFPNHAFLGEEDVPPGKEASAAALTAKLESNDWVWIVDPIDGTTNFANGMPLCMPSVACAYKGQVVVGVIYDCHRDELFTAIRGDGAKLNGNPIKVGEQETLGDAIIAMGSPPADESMKMSLKGVAALMPKVRTIRMLGSAALMLAWVANGRLTSYWEYDLSSWDIAAGALIIKEAGGRFTDFEGNDFDIRNRKICATNGLIHSELLQELKNAGIQ